jgi:hypothetical protein
MKAGFEESKPEDGDQTCPQNVMSYMQIQTMEKV